MKEEPLRYAHDYGYTHVCFSDDGSKYITCGADGDVRIWSIDENEDPIHCCVGEWALCVHQNGDNVYVSTESNNIQIVSYPKGERNGILDRFVAPINHITSSKDGKIFALAGEDMQIKLIKCLENKEIFTLENMKGPCLSVALDSTSQFLAASSGDGYLRIWDLDRRQIIKEIDCVPKVNSFSNCVNLCRMDFEMKSGKLFAYPNKKDIIILNTKDWKEIKCLNCNVIDSDLSIVRFSPNGKYLAASSISGDILIWDYKTHSLIHRFQHPKSINICEFSWNTSTNNHIIYTDKEGQLGMLLELFHKEDNSHINEECGDDNSVETDEDDDISIHCDNYDVSGDDDDNENAVSLEKIKKQFCHDDFDDASSTNHPTPRPRTPEIPMQSHFMPSSTPEHLNPRYLCWNDVGIIRSYNSDDDDLNKSIEVEFHDSTFHNSMMLQNYQNFTMGSISKSALIVANAEQINVIPLTGGTKDWNLTVEPHENIILVSTSNNLICFATNNYIVRIASIFGTQRGVFKIPGPIITMNSFDNYILIAYHYAAPRKNDQCINFKLITINNFNLNCKDLNSALNTDSTLLWMGFSDKGTPAMMDSSGLLSLYPDNCNIWIPFCDTSRSRLSPSDGYFVTSVFESYQTVGGIKCKGSNYPGFIPRPNIYELTLYPLFAEKTTEKTQMEMNLFTWKNLQVNDVNKKIKEAGLKLFALACKNNLDQRALEFMEIMADSQLINLSLKYASKLEKRRLAEKLANLALLITNDNEENEDFATSFMDSSLKTSTSPRVVSLNLSKNKRKSLINVKNNTTPSTKSQSSSVSTVLTELPLIDTQESLFSQENKNPFVNAERKTNSDTLNKIDTYCDTTNKEKRKQPDTIDRDEETPKQRKLDRFLHK